jgi:hypothetical protein
MNPRLRPLSLGLGLALATACVGPGVEELSPTASRHDDIFNGTTASPLRSVYALSMGCTGTLVGRRHILTARHCNPAVLPLRSAAAGVTPTARVLDAAGAVIRTYNIVAFLHHPVLDASVALLDTDAQEDPIGLVEEPMQSWVGRSLFVAGAGGRNVAPQGLLGSWQAISTVSLQGSSADPANTYLSARGPNNEHACGGDSGGPGFVWNNGQWKVAALTVGGDQFCNMPSGSTASVRADALVPWLAGIVPFRTQAALPVGGQQAALGSLRARVSANALYEGVPRLDAAGLSVVAASGTTPLTRWTADPSNGWRLGFVDAALADFTGDQVADLAALDDRGFRVFRGSLSASDVYSVDAPTATSSPASPVLFRPDGTTQTTPLLNTHVAYGGTRLTFGDFNGGGADVIFQNHRVAYFYGTIPGAAGTLVEGPQLGTWFPGRSLGRGDATLTAADFTGDGRTDVIVQLSDGAWLLPGSAATIASVTGTRPQGFSAPVALGASLAAGQAELVPGRFVNTAASPGYDLLVLTSTGLRVMASAAAGTFSYTSFSRPDLRAGATQTVVADFNRDGGDDVVFVVTSGAWLYLQTASGFSPGTWSDASALPVVTSLFASDADGDGAADLWLSNGTGTRILRGLVGGTAFAPPGASITAASWVRSMFRLR